MRNNPTHLKKEASADCERHPIDQRRNLIFTFIFEVVAVATTESMMDIDYATVAVNNKGSMLCPLTQSHKHNRNVNEEL